DFGCGGRRAAGAPGEGLSRWPRAVAMAGRRLRVVPCSLAQNWLVRDGGEALRIAAMKLTFLGTGTSAGVPMIGCRCAVCRSEDPRNRRYRTHAHLAIGGLSILIDAAQEFRLQAIKHRIDALDMMLLTHGHADHILGCDDLRRYCDGKA